MTASEKRQITEALKWAEGIRKQTESEFIQRRIAGHRAVASAELQLGRRIGR